MTKVEHISGFRILLFRDYEFNFRMGPLKYEADVYEFAKKVFNEYVDRAGIERYVKPPK